MRTTTRLCIGAAVAVIALSGCADGGDSAGPGASPTPTATAAVTSGAPESATPTPMPSTPAALDCADDGIVPGRLGCLDTNVPVAGNPGEALVAWEADFCASGDGRYVYSAAPELVALGGETGTAIGRIDIYDPSLTTAEGIHVGSTEAEVAAAYPATPPTTSFSGTKLVVIGGAEGFITIELADGWSTEPWAVANIRIYAADQDPNVPVYGTEDFAGACPIDF